MTTDAVDPGSPQEQARQTFPVWSSRRAFVLSTAAAAIGLGNLWRFPYLAGENGGAAFLAAYAVCLATLAIPFAAIEVAAGRGSRGGIVQTLTTLRPSLRRFGWAVILLTLLITSYYVVLTGWTMGYAVSSLDGAVPFFADFSDGYASLWWFLATLALCAGVLAFGLGAIEAIGKFGTPVLLLILIGLAGVALTLGPGTQKALDFLFALELADLGDRRVWAVALGQTFFSLAVGQGYLVTFGSYLPTDIPAARSVALVAGVNAFAGVIAGVVMFPFVFAAGIDPGQGSDLAFTALPRALSEAPADWLLTPLFFCAFFLAAFSSCLAGMKVLTAGLRDWRQTISDRRAILAVAVALLVLGLPSALSYTPAQWRIFGLPVLDAADRIAGTTMVVLFGLTGAMVMAWAMPARLWADWLPGQSRATTHVMIWMARIVPPLLVAAVIVDAATGGL